MFLVDSHCHLDLLDLTADSGDVAKVIERARQHGVHHLLNVCVSLKHFQAVLTTASAYPFVSASVGLHPNEQAEEADTDTLLALAQPQKVVAIGETGLDYFRSQGEMNWQRERFRAHVRAAHITKKPLIIHTRQAQEDTIQVMQEEQADQVGGVMHCFTETWPMAKQALDMGFYISFSGIVTFKNALSIQEVACKVPLDRMLLETDSPYLAPIPFRGKTNEPANVKYIAAYMAALRKMSVADLAEQTTRNFFTLFKGAERTHV